MKVLLPLYMPYVWDVWAAYFVVVTGWELLQKIMAGRNFGNAWAFKEAFQWPLPVPLISRA
jgi:hypothetical protein